MYVRRRIALRGKWRRIVGVIKSYPGALFRGRWLIIYSTSEGRKAGGGNDIGKGWDSSSNTRWVWMGSLSGWGVNIVDRWDARRAAFSSLDLAQLPFAVRNGEGASLCDKKRFVAFQRDLSSVVRELVKFLYLASLYSLRSACSLLFILLYVCLSEGALVFCHLARAFLICLNKSLNSCGRYCL